MDITQEFEQKMPAFKQHESPHGELLEKEYGVADWSDVVKMENQLRGFQYGCNYAERGVWQE